MVLTVTEDTPADMLAGSMELLVQLPRDHHLQTQRVTVQRRYICTTVLYFNFYNVISFIHIHVSISRIYYIFGQDSSFEFKRVKFTKFQWRMYQKLLLQIFHLIYYFCLIKTSLVKFRRFQIDSSLHKIPLVTFVSFHFLQKIQSQLKMRYLSYQRKVLPRFEFLPVIEKSNHSVPTFLLIGDNS